MRRVLAFVAASTLAFACHTITEDLPTRPTAAVVVTPSQPVVVTPIANPTPNPNTPAPGPTPVVVTPVTPNVTPTPNPADDPGGIPPDIPNNNNPVVKVGIKIFFVECDGQQVPGSEGGHDADVGCRVHLDATTKDAANKPTRAKGTPHWQYSDFSLIKSINESNPYNPVFTAGAAGTLDVRCDVDGITSNTLTIHLH